MKSLILILLLAFSVTAQQQSLPSDLQKSLSEIDASLFTIQSQLNELNRKKDALLQDRLALIKGLIGDQSNPGIGSRVAVLRVAGPRTVRLLIGEREQDVYLSGLVINTGQAANAESFLNDALSLRTAYLRCSDPSCTEAELSINKDSPSLNCQLVSLGIAADLTGNSLACAPNTSTQLPIAPDSASAPSSKHVPGTDVQVKGYYRKDGTYVRPHTRSAPRRRN